jgi:SAM-dependent methyltransferase
MSERKQHWEQVYSNKTPLEVSWYQKKPSISLRLIQDSVRDREQPVLDVGGGASLLADRLLERLFTNISVLDLSARALQHARERLGEQADKINWYESDIIEFEPPHQFACWHDRAVFHFLTDGEERKKYLEALTKALRPNGRVIIAAFAIGGPTKCSGLDIVQYDAKKISRELGDGFKLIEKVNELHVTPDDRDQWFTYYRFLRR